MTDLVLVGRSSSHFTRTARIFALELGVPLTLRPVLDLTSQDPATYAGNPALKVPVLVDEEGALFGTENICRALACRAGARARGLGQSPALPGGAPTMTRVVLRGDVGDRLVANAEEMTLHVMSNEVSLIMAQTAGDDRLAPPKVRRSLDNGLRFLDESVDRALDALPADRTVSFLEATLFCLVTHLPFRKVMDVSGYTRLGAFAARFGERESARRTEYRFDAP